MRKLIVAGNWKMNTTLQEGVALANEIEKMLEGKNPKAEAIVAPPFIHLTSVANVIEKVQLSAQNCASEEKGAYTGEVSAAMVKSAGARYVIIGHSERRSYYHEDDAVLEKKVKQALGNDLLPIFCIGEQLEEREANKQEEVVKSQLENAVFTLDKSDFEKLVLAYEPVWAIGTGKTATPEQAQEIHKYIRGLVREKYGEETADNTTILYGGSCKPSNAAELFSNPDVDGGLIGGASLNAE
ncbi:MAG: triose-phosphate isomerase, partial [Bacteroidota bacterium]